MCEYLTNTWNDIVIKSHIDPVFAGLVGCVGIAVFVHIEDLLINRQDGATAHHFCFHVTDSSPGAVHRKAQLVVHLSRVVNIRDDHLAGVIGVKGDRTSSHSLSTILDICRICSRLPNNKVNQVQAA